MEQLPFLFDAVQGDFPPPKKNDSRIAMLKILFIFCFFGRFYAVLSTFFVVI